VNHTVFCSFNNLLLYGILRHVVNFCNLALHQNSIKHHNTERYQLIMDV